MGTSSLVEGKNWSNGQPPVASNDYISNKKLIRTPGKMGFYTFAGRSLTLEKSTLSHKGESRGVNNVITIESLHLKSSTIVNSVSKSFVMEGSITLTGTGTLLSDSTHAEYEINSVISGEGALKILNPKPTAMANEIILSGENTYSGGTTIDKDTNITVSSHGTLGMGKVSINEGKLTLKNPTSIADSAGLVLTSMSAENSVVLDFTGVETISSLSFNGASIAPGTYTAKDLNSHFNTHVFGGTGSIKVLSK